ncbi:hypothetical protein BS627_03070 [Agrobacterium salinitolerans]|uniref:IS3 family transposase n=1 Tax=Agrobacterium salinitolerans TaxID=1183413 RepID=UPI0009CAF486|nr:hypothetical protein BS627_03070 [Agrobacterium salinitolerans]PNQ25616.1 hypothetical protein C2E26_03130 [Rhizobium sp. YIC5082]
MIDLPRSTYYYQSTAKALNLGDSELIIIIEYIQDELPCYGYRRVTYELQRRGHIVNHKRVARVMRANASGSSLASGMFARRIATTIRRSTRTFIAM